MQCPACQRENPSGNRFCGGCGAPLSRSCPSCGASNPPEQAFCGQCGTRLEPGAHAGEQRPSKQAPEAAAPAAEAELRQLTVMFCDLVGSTELSQQFDPEDMRELVRAYQETCAQVIARFDGQIAQYLGDGLLVYFGYPEAHEDDAVRGVNAGLSILEDIPRLSTQIAQRLSALRGRALEVRISVHTGPVVVGEMGGGAKREHLALGETLNLAARLQGVAEPGWVVISAATRGLVQGVFVLEELGEKSLKGIAQPVPAYRVLRPSGVQTRLELAATRGLTPLVGREQEMALMLDRWETVKEGHGQALLLSGEAGMGKSRLVQTLRERLAEEALTWLECGGSSYHENSAFHPVIELLEQGMLFGPDDPPENRFRKLETGLQQLGLGDPEALPLLASLLSLPLPAGTSPLPLSPEAQRRRTLEFLAAWIFDLSEQRPVVLVVEDLHWIDPSSLELLDLLIEQIPTAPVLLLLSFRPEFEAQWTLRSHLVHLTLHPLTQREVRTMVEGITGGKTLPAAVLDQVVKKTDGVPLFVEELTKSVLESGLLAEGEERYERTDPLPELAIPSTLQDSLMARLDRLVPAKEVAQLAAVLGRQFPFELLEAVWPLDSELLESGLARLVKAELLYQRGVLPRATYTFKHALIQETAYQSLLRSNRRRHHLRVAEALTDRMPKVTETQPELVAYHLTEAGEEERAVAWWQRAGEQASARAANEEAIRHLRRGLALLDELVPGVQRDRLELGLQLPLGTALVAARGFAHAETVHARERAQALCDPIVDPLQSAVIRWGLGTSFISQGNPRKALETSAQLLRMAEREGNELFAIAGDHLGGMALLLRGELGASCERVERAFGLYDPARHRFLEAGFHSDAGISALAFGSWAFWHRGFPDRAWELAEEAVRLARRSRQPYALAINAAYRGVTAMLRGDWANAQKLATEAVHIGESQGFPLAQSVGLMVEAFSESRGGEHPGGSERYAAAMTMAAGTGNRGAAPLILGLLAELQLAEDRVEQAAHTAEGALAIARETGQAFRDAELHRLKGEMFLELPDHAEDEAEALFREAIDIARRQEAKSLELRAATSLARLWQRQGKRNEGRDLLAPIYDWFTEGFDTRDLKDAKNLLEALR